jgi:hypothetical protein
MNSFDPFQEPLDHNDDADRQSQRDYSERVLKELRQRRRTEANRWLRELAKDSFDNNPEVDDASASANSSSEDAHKQIESFEPLQSIVPLPPFSPFVGEERVGDPGMQPQQPLVSEEFSRAVENLSFAVDNELARLSSLAGKAAQMSDLATLARCKRLVLELSHFREVVSANLANMQASTNQNDKRSAA